MILRSLPLLLLATLAAPAVHADVYEDVTAASGIAFQHTNGASGEYYMTEVMGSGVGLIDYDRDGDLDVYLVNGRGSGSDGAAPTDRLYRNDGGTPLRFVDVTEAMGIRESIYGMGVAVGDFDGDGWDDLYLTNIGPNQLLRNEGGQRFVEVTSARGAEEDPVSVPAVFFDMDGDLDLDLFVGNNIEWAEQASKPCRTVTGLRDYCGPQVFTARADRLLRNDGGSYSNVTVSSGISVAFGPALGVVAADFDDDGDIDLYVANDGTANQLWINQGDGRFRNEAMLAGVALNMEGAPEASMGVDAADIDDDGDLDLFMTHLTSQTNTLYLNEGDGWFEDATATRGLGAPSLPMTGFGTAFTDFDLDGILDLLAVNGAVISILEQRDAGIDPPLRMPNQLFRGTGGGHFQDVSDTAGAAILAPDVSRGLAIGDLDGDGDDDAIITNNAGDAQVLMNRAGDGRGWIGLDLREASGASSTAALVRFDCGDLPPRWRRARREGSYVSSSDPRVTLGLGIDGPATCDATVTWSGGARSEHSGLAAGRYHRIVRPEQH